jgi:hypothetical protein
MKLRDNPVFPTFGPMRAVLAAAIAIPLLVAASPASALSELKREEVPADAPQDEVIEREELPPPETEDSTVPREAQPVPLPDPVVIPRDAEQEDEEPETAAPGEPDEPLPQIHYDVSLLPEPVARLRELIMAACLSGDIEQLRPLIGNGGSATQLSFGGAPEDPIAFLREVSGDGEGHEILAILYEVLAAGYVHLEEGTQNEIYVWPYFFAIPLDQLDGRQKVELFTIVTAGDYQDMENFGAYIFYRVGISPEGRWLFFVAGD